MGLFHEMGRLYGAMERRICPGLLHAQTRYQKVLERLASEHDRWLDLGCGWHLLQPWLLQDEQKLVARVPLLVGVDPDVAALRRHRTIRQRLAADAAALPFRDGAFDLVTANMVVEHLTDPAEQFAEIGRVLEPGGEFVFHTPNVRGYIARTASAVPEGAKRLLVRLLEKRSADDLYPTHYRANSTEAIRELADRAGFRVVSIECIMTRAQTAVVPPLALMELIWLRQLRARPSLAHLRPNLVVRLQWPV